MGRTQEAIAAHPSAADYDKLMVELRIENGDGASARHRSDAPADKAQI